MTHCVTAASPALTCTHLHPPFALALPAHTDSFYIHIRQSDHGAAEPRACCPKLEVDWSLAFRFRTVCVAGLLIPTPFTRCHLKAILTLPPGLPLSGFVFRSRQVLSSGRQRGNGSKRWHNGNISQTVWCRSWNCSTSWGTRLKLKSSTRRTSLGSWWRATSRGSCTTARLFPCKHHEAEQAKANSQAKRESQALRLRITGTCNAMREVAEATPPALCYSVRSAAASSM